MDYNTRENTKYRPEGKHEDCSAVYSTSLTQPRLSELTEHLRTNPDNLQSRFQLLGHYLRVSCSAKGSKQQAARKSYTEHLLWLVDNHPRHVFHAQNRGFSEDSYFADVKSHWDNQVKSNANDVTVLFHAATFNQIAAPIYSTELLTRASSLDSNNEKFPETLCELYLTQAHDSDQKDREKFARLAFKEFMTALERYENYCADKYKKNFLYRFDLTGDRVAASAIDCGLFDEAKQIAHLVMSRTTGVVVTQISEQVTKGELYGIISSKNTGNAILGLVAIAEQDMDGAVRHLENLIVSEPYNHVESDFANALLICGKGADVKLYLERANELFKHQAVVDNNDNNTNELHAERIRRYAAAASKKISRWVREIEKGNIPTLERF